MYFLQLPLYGWLCFYTWWAFGDGSKRITDKELVWHFSMQTFAYQHKTLSTTEADGNALRFWSKKQSIEQIKIWPGDGARVNVRASPKLLEIHPTVVEITHFREIRTLQYLSPFPSPLTLCEHSAPLEVFLFWAHSTL